MKSNYVLVVFVVDESGSMSICRDKVIEGFNEFLSEQRKDKNGDVDVSLYKFATDGLNNCVYKMKNIKEVNDISEKDYNPSGLTALNDAVCTAIDETGKILADKKEDERPSKVIFVIMTDGHENCSVEFGANDVKEKIKHQEEKYSWNFVYLGYNLSDAAMLKDNHIDAAGSITAAITKLRQRAGHMVKIEVETRNLQEVQEALDVGADVIMLDNMDVEQMRRAVELNNGRALLEASGNITDQTIAAVAQTGVDIISIGALTHSVQAFDISMKIK